LIPKFEEQTKSVIKISILTAAGGTVQTDYETYGTWVAEMISWTDPKTWFIEDEARMAVYDVKTPGIYCFENSRTIVGSTISQSGSNLFLSFKPCQAP